MFTIYQIINTINKHSYIGFTSKSIQERWAEHKKNAKSGKLWTISCAIRKYGVGSFVIETLEEGWDQRIGKEIREPFWISALRPEYNMTAGGDGLIGHSGWKWTESQKRAIRRPKSSIVIQNMIEGARNRKKQGPPSLETKLLRRLNRERKKANHVTL
jgi:group I intron endonuclease